MKRIHLMARRPGEKEFGIRSKLDSENLRQFLPENNKEFMTQQAVEKAAHNLAVRWAEAVKDGTEYKVVAI